MKRPDPDVVKALAAATLQYPQLFTWLNEWRLLELEALPYSGQNVTVAQGRCQVLSEITRLAKDAPDLAAKPKQAAV
jgi:hypothetical protein